jgi:tRNA A37 N6-isopentenylltransferase MiaA
MLSRVQDKDLNKKSLEDLLKRGLSSWSPLNSVGYKETQSYLKGEITKQGLQDLIVQNTMRLAKKQGTWFRRDEGIIWFDPDHSRHAPLYYIHQLMVKYLS